MVYICPIGSRGGMNYLFFEKSVFVKHPNVEGVQTTESTVMAVEDDGKEREAIKKKDEASDQTKPSQVWKRRK